MTAEASNSLDFTNLTPGMDVEQVFGLRKSTLMPIEDDEGDDSPVAPIRESTVSLHGLGNSAEFSGDNEGKAVGVGDSVLKAADAGHADAEAPARKHTITTPFPDLSEPDAPAFPIPPIELTEEEVSNVMGDLLGLGGDSDDDSDVDDDSDGEVELGDGVVALPKAPPSRRSAMKTTGASMEPDEWAGIATNYEQVVEAATTSARSASAADVPVMPERMHVEGLKELGSARTDAVDTDDEFEYAFEGKKREGPTHQIRYVPKAAPSHLITNVHNTMLAALQEDEEEEEDGEEEPPRLELAEEARSATSADEWRTEDFPTELPPVAPEPAAQRGPGTSAPPPPAPAEGMDGAQAALSALSLLPVPEPEFGDGVTRERSEAFEMSVTEEDFPAQDPTARARAGGALAGPGPGADADLASEFERVTNLNSGTSADAAAGAGACGTAALPDGRGGKGKTPAVPPVSYKSAAKFFETVDISMYLSVLEVEDTSHQGWWLKLFRCLGPPALKGELAAQRERVFGLAKIQFDDDEPMHFRVLQSIFKKFTGAQGQIPRYGAHWEDVGFQGSDPATDLRSCGMLGLMQLLYLHHHHKKNAEHIYMLSRDAVQEFPMAPLSINITRITLQALRRGLLSTEIKKRKDVSSVVSEYYVGGFYQFYLLWKTGGKTMRDSGFVTKELETHMFANPKKVIEQCQLELGGKQDIFEPNERDPFVLDKV
eukprot:CAMPEP_0114244054 /NCGR_PEP_ID=MMETSP0058-20121206/11127_1 /TAXON_ID=36894 /ORGANISM="Pyramimonas parkeae, CCMP726" /LENGTH=712 /DNA_ID=CAMNT_0001356953 /DNA_START=355 /DNA_END=2493 /DNA_ORIENTATION=-